MVDLNRGQVRIAAALADAAYNRGADGNPGGAGFENMSHAVRDRFEVETLSAPGSGSILNSNSGEVIYGFRDRETGDLYVAARGTDDGMPGSQPGVNGNDWSDWDNAFVGARTDLGATLAFVVQEYSSRHGGQSLVVAGHSLGGLASEEVARIHPDLVSIAYNIQGPSIVDGPSDMWPSFLATGFWSSVPPGAPVIKIGNSPFNPYDLDGLGFLQYYLDRMGMIVNPPTYLAINSGTHNSQDALRALSEIPHCFLRDSSVQMWPLDPSIKPRLDGSYDEEEVLSKVWYKYQDQMRAGDFVVSYDKQGRLQPGRVTRTMTNASTHILDFWDTGVTPGQAYY